MDPAHERDLVDRAKTGDRAAFNALVERYWPPLCRWLSGMTGISNTAEDLTQETFVRAWSALPMLKDIVTFRVWLFRIARNVLLLQQRGPRGRAPSELDGTETQRASDPPAEAMENESRAALQAAISRLPEPYRAAYLLWSNEDLPHVEIARVLSITEANARWRVHEARRMLLKAMHAFLETPSS